MPEGYVQAKGASRNGKPTVTIDGQLYYTGSTNLTGMNVGDKVSFLSNSSVYKGQTNWFLNDWKLLEASKGTLVSPSAPVPNAAPRPQAEPSVGHMTEAERIFASVVVKGAFESGLIKDKADLGIWTAHARDVLRNT